METVRGMEHISYKEKLKDLGFILEKGRLQRYIIPTFQYLKGACKKAVDKKTQLRKITKLLEAFC